jgi:peptide/nickel transport system permease protein
MPGVDWRSGPGKKLNVPVLRYLALRAAAAVGTLLAASIVIYGALFLAPGSPVSFLVSGQSASPERIAAIKAQYHLNDGFFTQWWSWLTAAIHGDFGTSLIYRGSSVWSLVEPRLGTTVLLITYAGILTVVFGALTGTLAALRGGKVDAAVVVVTSVGLGIPSFVTAILLIAAFGVALPWFPTFGAGSGFADALYHLTLPAVALALAGWAYVSRVTKAR